MQKRAAIYARISTSDQKSLGNQLDQMKSYIKSRNWLHVKQVEEIASGAKTSQRFYEVAQEEIMGGTALGFRKYDAA